MITVPDMPDLKSGVTYKVKFKDESDSFYADFICFDRGFICFNHAGSVIVCRPENIEISL